LPLSDAFLKELQALIGARGAKWTAGRTSLFGLTDDELARRAGCLPEPGERGPEDLEAVSAARRAKPPAVPSALLVQAWDWRNVNGRNYINPVRDQGSCGSCAAFGTVATMEGMVRILSNLPVLHLPGLPGWDGFPPYLSEAHLFFCGGGTCPDGWYISSALNFAKNTGVVPAKCFPYTPVDQPCSPCAGWQDHVTQVQAWHQISSPAEMKAWLSTRGPLVTRFNVYSDFHYYHGGVYTYLIGELEGGHAVCCVGYDDARQAWLCKNSWGTGWGGAPGWGDMEGYFWIGYGQCCIDDSMYAIDSFSQMFPKPQYLDIFMRDNLVDGGHLPSSGPLCQSPDIIPYGDFPVPFPGALFTSTYGQDVGQDVDESHDNYIYVRARNLNPFGLHTGRIHLYYSRSSLLLWPSLWSQNAIQTLSGGNCASVWTTTFGAIVVGDTPFKWTPLPLPPGAHYCLIARVETQAHPNPVPADGAITDFGLYVACNPAVVWRNVTLIPRKSLTATVSVDLMVHEPVELFIALEAFGLEGCTVRFGSREAASHPRLLTKEAVITGPRQAVGVRTTLPRDFHAPIEVSYRKGRRAVQPGAMLRLAAYYPVVKPDDPLARFAAPGPAGIGQAVLLGEYTLKFIEDEHRIPTELSTVQPPRGR